MTGLTKASIAVLFMALTAVSAGFFISRHNAEGPIQPIAFNHRIHAGDNQISCLYCHTGASRSTLAGVPSVATCYECHRIVKLKNAEIAKILHYWETKQPIAWVRVHELPDYVYFS